MTCVWGEVDRLLVRVNGCFSLIEEGDTNRVKPSSFVPVQRHGQRGSGGRGGTGSGGPTIRPDPTIQSLIHPEEPGR